MLLALFRQELVKYNLHIIAIYLDRGAALFSQADQGAGNAVDKFFLDIDIASIF